MRRELDGRARDATRREKHREHAPSYDLIHLGMSRVVSTTLASG
jgi:hypothetical protein